MDINEFFEHGFCYDEPSKIEVGDDFIDNDALPFLVSKEAWTNYTDDVIYDVDKRMRTWLSEMCENEQWTKSYRARRYQYHV